MIPINHASRFLPILLLDWALNNIDQSKKNAQYVFFTCTCFAGSNLCVALLRSDQRVTVFRMVSTT